MPIEPGRSCTGDVLNELDRKDELTGGEERLKSSEAFVSDLMGMLRLALFA